MYTIKPALTWIWRATNATEQQNLRLNVSEGQNNAKGRLPQDHEDKVY